MKITVNKHTFLPYICLFALCMPTTVSVIKTLCTYIELIGIVLSILLLINSEYKQRQLYPIFAWVAWIFIASLINHTSVYNTWRMVYPIFCCVILTDYLIMQQGIKAIRNITFIFAFAFIAQAFTCATKIMGKYNSEFWNYFFGLRVEFNNIFIFGIAISLILALLYKQRRTANLLAIIIIVCGVYFVFAEQLSTGIMTCVIFAFVVLASYFFRSRFFWTTVIIVVVAACIYFVSSGMDTSGFSWLLNDILDEGLTLNGRTELWASSISQMNGVHWIYGNGYGHSYWFQLNGVDKATTAHSQYLNIIFNYGIIGLVLYLYLYIMQIKVYLQCGRPGVRRIILGVIISSLFMGIATTTYEDVYMYIWLIICITINNVIDSEEDIRTSC